MIVVLIVVATLSFSLVYLSPGDPATLILGDNATPEDIAMIRRQMGLDQPLPIQLALWFRRLLQGELGDSFYYGEPVVKMILQRVEPSGLLSLMGATFAVLIGVPLGVAASVRRGRFVDRLIMAGSVLGMSIPSFWFALNLILLFSVYLRWTPVSGYTRLDDSVVGALHSLILPAVAVGLAQAAWLARVTRSAMLEVLMADYVRTARAKGLREQVVLYRHALRNAILPVVTVIGIVLVTFFSAAVIIEDVFALPGVGRLVTMAMRRRDYPTIQGVVVFVGVVYAFVNLVVDLLYAYLNPQVKYG